MKIGAKLLLTYLVLVGVVASVALFLLPRFVENRALQVERVRLQKLVEKQADYLSQRLNEGVQGRNASELAAANILLAGADKLLTDDTIVFVDDRCVIQKASSPALKGKQLPDCKATAGGGPLSRLAARRGTVNLDKPYIVAVAPLTVDVPALQGYSVAMIRDMDYVNQLTRPINTSISVVVLIALVASLLIAGSVSRGMVHRIQEAGDTARALAEGDLTQRVPETGTDEITELAGHFNHMAERIQVLVEGLKRSEQSRKELLITVSHELRTPMTSISGFAEALRDGVIQGEERKQRYYQIIASESGRLTRLINDLFDVTKLEAGQLEMRLQAMAAAPWLAEFNESFKPVTESAGVHLALRMEPAAEQARIYGDRDRLDQVLTNLVSNALHFAPKESTITLRARVDGPDLLIEVADQGPGIPPEDAGRIFDRFFQGQNQGNGHKGAGLGLAIVKSLVEAHGGTVGVTSTPGQGAAFWFRMKLLA